MNKASLTRDELVLMIFNAEMDGVEKQLVLAELARNADNLRLCEQALSNTMTTSNARAQELGFAERRIQVALAVLECDRPMVLEDIAAVIWPAPGPSAGLTDSEPDLSQIPTGSPGEETFLGGRFIKTL